MRAYPIHLVLGLMLVGCSPQPSSTSNERLEEKSMSSTNDLPGTNVSALVGTWHWDDEMMRMELRIELGADGLLRQWNLEEQRRRHSESPDMCGRWFVHEALLCLLCERRSDVEGFDFMTGMTWVFELKSAVPETLRLRCAVGDHEREVIWRRIPDAPAPGTQPIRPEPKQTHAPPSLPVASASLRALTAGTWRWSLLEQPTNSFFQVDLSASGSWQWSVCSNGVVALPGTQSGSWFVQDRMLVLLVKKSQNCKLPEGMAVTFDIQDVSPQTLTLTGFTLGEERTIWTRIAQDGSANEIGRASCRERV